MDTHAVNADLLRKVMEFEIDDGSPELTFARRLALENGWRLRFAERVIVEYRRFVYLAMAAGHPVTPSEEVDEAWHLHLTYTESYWNRLCRDVLPRPLHHNPTRGGAAENAKFEDWYGRTLETYTKTFGSPPPGDIWPGVPERFGRSIQRRKIEPNRYWIIPKPRARYLLLGTLLSATGCAAFQFKDVYELGWEVIALVGFLLLVAIVVLLKVIVALIKGQPVGKPLRTCSGGGSGGCASAGIPITCGSGNSGGDSCADSGGGGDSGGCGGGGCGGGN